YPKLKFGKRKVFQVLLRPLRDLCGLCVNLFLPLIWPNLQVFAESIFRLSISSGSSDNATRPHRSRRPVRSLNKSGPKPPADCLPEIRSLEILIVWARSFKISAGQNLPKGNGSPVL